MAANVHLEMVTSSTDVQLNSAYGAMGTVVIQLKERSHTQHRIRQVRVTGVDIKPPSDYWFLFYLPLFVLSQSPQLRNLNILNLLRLNSKLERQLCIDLAPQIADFAVNYTRGSLGWFLMKADVEVARVEERSREVDSGGEVGTCMVCLEEFSSVVEPIKMPCCHLFHESCICRWLEEKNSCPICRREIDSYE